MTIQKRIGAAYHLVKLRLIYQEYWTDVEDNVGNDDSLGTVLENILIEFIPRCLALFRTWNYILQTVPIKAQLLFQNTHHYAIDIGPTIKGCELSTACRWQILPPNKQWWEHEFLQSISALVEDSLDASTSRIVFSYHTASSLVTRVLGHRRPWLCSLANSHRVSNSRR